MSDECIFCRIVDGEIPARTVYETNDILGFLDANPLAQGHTLVIPKQHHERLNDVPTDLGQDLYAGVHELVPAIESAVAADASTIAFNNGEAAGQEVPHVHCHIIPRFENDGGAPIHAIAGSRPELSDAELDSIASEISNRV
ncbi:MAG: HIT family protein [Halobacteriaceae archaeon]